MTIHETGHIRNELNQSGPVNAPLFCDDSYMNGEYVDGGFPVDDKPAEPEHVIVRMGPQYTVINDDMDSRFREAERNVPKEVIRVGNSVRYVTEDEETEADRKERQADAVAAAVKSAILRGEIDASEFAIE